MIIKLNLKGVKRDKLSFILIFMTLLILWNKEVVSFSLEKREKPEDSRKEKAIFLKMKGDSYTEKQDFKNAALYYMEALKLSRDFFTREEKKMMAMHIAWSGKLRFALKELELLIKEDSEDWQTRIIYARVLSGLGKLGRALEEVNLILLQNPDQKEALLIRADILRLSGFYDMAISLYSKLLEGGENFDARLGLTYALLKAKYIKKAKKSRNLLKAVNLYQQNELSQLDATLKSETSPFIEAKYSFYEDSEKNGEKRASFLFGFFAAEKLNMNINFIEGDVSSPSMEKKARNLFLNMNSRLTPFFELKGGAGITQIGNEGGLTLGRGFLQAELQIRAGLVRVFINRETFTQTVELIENKIRSTSSGIFISKKIEPRYTLSGTYSYRNYSDANKAHDIDFSIGFAFRLSRPRAEYGYGIKYLDFKYQTRNGYFDPSNYFAHHIFITFFHENERFFLYFHPFFGIQYFRRYGAKIEDIFAGGTATVQVALAKNFLLEFHLERSDYAGAQITGLKYILASSGIILRF